MEKLRPCQLCGGPAEFHWVDNLLSVKCLKCNNRNHAERKFVKPLDKERAERFIALQWNTRGLTEYN